MKKKDEEEEKFFIVYVCAKKNTCICEVREKRMNKSAKNIINIK
jgi:hypothetical protein